MVNLLLVATAPVFIILAYIYYRDKYEKEPISLLIQGLIAGGVIVLPILYFGQLIKPFGEPMPHIYSAAYTSFIVAALVEEGFKIFAVYMLIWKNPNFNERFDGIVYAVFVSLGFALVENIGYVFGSSNGINLGLLRAFTAVPAHAMFGITMGYWIGLARFVPSKRKRYLSRAFTFPFLFHGIYDFILMSKNNFLLILFFPLLIYMFIRARKHINLLAANSVFNPENG